MIDEAMALACGGDVTDADVVGRAVCSFFTACYFTADFRRVGQWAREFQRVGLVGAASGTPAFLRSHCDSVRGTLLCHIGRWGEADDVLSAALADINVAMPGTAWHPPIALAELRVLQGRLAEAEALLLGKDDHIQALLPAAQLHLARGDHPLARAVARRGLRLIGDDRVRASSLLGVVVEAELGCGDVDAARRAANELHLRSVGLGLPMLAGEAARVLARVLAAEGDPTSAIAVLQRGAEELAPFEFPLCQAILHIDLARMREAAGQRAEAVIDARAAAAILSRLDVVITADAAGVFRRLGVEIISRTSKVGCRVAKLHREGEWWSAGCEETTVRLRDTKGLRYLAELVAHPGTERHAFDLVALVEGVPAAGSGGDRRLLGDAGELIDATSRATYRRRVEELRDEIEYALGVEDDARAATLQTEADALVAELARAFGLGGRERRASSAAQRARLNVTRALRAALAKLTEALPGPGEALDRRVRTGFFCAYEPHADCEVLWSVQS